MSATDQAAADDATVRGEATEEERAATEAARAATDLATRDDFTLPARHRWDGSQVEVIRRTVAKDCDKNELAMFLEVAARYELDPFIRELFAAKFDGPDGPVTIFAGRDGFLKAARNTRRLRHMESSVVRANDEYEVVVDTDQVHHDPESGQTLNKLRRLRHVKKGMGTGTYDEESKTWIGGRGPIVGAYALVYLHGDEEPWFAEATWEDYGAGKQQTRRGGKTNWTIGSGFTEAMMVKVPQSIALRMGCGLAGIYAQEEVQKRIDEAGRQDLSGSRDGEHKTPGVHYPDGEVGATLQVLVERCNELVPGSWRDAKVAMNVNGKSEEQLLALASKLRAFIATRAPEDPLAQEPEHVTDAVVVEPSPEAQEFARQSGGAVAQALLDRMHDEEDVRVLVQERYHVIREALSGMEGPEMFEGSPLGFGDFDAMVAEEERLEAALREATNGGPTVAEEMDTPEPEPEDAPEEPEQPGPGEVDGDEPDAAGETAEVVDAEPVEGEELPEWSEATAEEYQQLEHAIADLEAALEESEGEAKRILTSNLADARERYTLLRKAKAVAERADR